MNIMEDPAVLFTFCPQKENDQGIMKMYSRHLNNQGITLIELLIGSSLLVIVLGIAFSLHSFGTRSFSSGASRGDVQQNARLVADFITSEIRFAKNADILESFSSSEEFEENFHYIFLESGSIMYKEKGENLLEKFSDISQKVDFELSFKISDDLHNDNDNVLKLIVSAEDDNERDFEVKTELIILNLTDKISGLEDNDPGTGIRFQLPSELEDT